MSPRSSTTSTSPTSTSSTSSSSFSSLGDISLGPVNKPPEQMARNYAICLREMTSIAPICTFQVGRASNYQL
jgi:hypothetical protein